MNRPQSWRGGVATGKVLLITSGVLVLGFLTLLTVLTIDGRACERWKVANHLRFLHRSWLQDGAPMPVNPSKYGYANWGTAYVYSATQVIDGTNYRGLFAFRDYGRPIHYAISTNGVVLDLGNEKRVRLVRYTPGKGAAW